MPSRSRIFHSTKIARLTANPPIADIHWSSNLPPAMSCSLVIYCTGPRPATGRHWPDGEGAGDLMEEAAGNLGMPYLGTLRGQTAILVCGTPDVWQTEGG